MSALLFIPLVSHSMSVIRKYCDRVIRLDHGHLLTDAPTADEFTMKVMEKR